MRQISPHTVIVTLIAILVSGTVFFHVVEGWSWLDSYFFTVVTISTVGYGSLVPITAVGKIGTTVLIFVGLGVFAVAIQQFARYQMQRRKEHTEWLIGHLGRDQDKISPPAANEDDKPETVDDGGAPDIPVRRT